MRQDVLYTSPSRGRIHLTDHEHLRPIIVKSGRGINEGGPGYLVKRSHQIWSYDRGWEADNKMRRTKSFC